MQHHILKEVVQAIKALRLLKSSEYSDIDAAAMKQLEMLWTSMADEFKEKGIDA